MEIAVKTEILGNWPEANDGKSVSEGNVGGRADWFAICVKRIACPFE
jgi:hypothetical protein